MEKVVKNGMVAVLYSPGFGAGWYTWNTKFPKCVFDPEIVAIVGLGEITEENLNAIKDIAQEKWGEDGFYDGGARDLEIEWIPEGTPFNIEEYDGSESVITRYQLPLTA